jgi:hypothetical protein
MPDQNSCDISQEVWNFLGAYKCLFFLPRPGGTPDDVLCTLGRETQG